MLAALIRCDNDIKGIKVDEIDLTISLMADDTTLFLEDINSLVLSIAIAKFQNIYGTVYGEMFAMYIYYS